MSQEHICCWALSPMTPRSSPSGTASELTSTGTGSTSTTFCIPTTNARWKRSSPATSTWRGIRRWPGCRPSASQVSSGSVRRPSACAIRTADLVSVIVTRDGGPVRSVGDLQGRRVAVGAKDSPQATLIPLLHLAQQGLEPGRDFEVLPFDRLVGKHGDHIGGERDAARALVRGDCDAACLIDGNLLLFAQEGTLPAGSVRTIATTPQYDHCNFTVLESAKSAFAGTLSGTSARHVLRGPGRAAAARSRGPEAMASRTDRRLRTALESGRPIRVPRRVRRGDSRAMHVDLEDLAFERGGALLVKRALRLAPVGEEVTVAGRAPDLEIHLRAWCRAEGHDCDGWRTPGPATPGSYGGPQLGNGGRGAQRAGRADPRECGAVLDSPPLRWGLAGRGALVEAGSPEFHFALDRKTEVWSGDAARMYASGCRGAVGPGDRRALGAPSSTCRAEVEDAVVQVMTYLIENETAALVVPSRFVAQMHPHFREVMQVLAIQAADEARHIEVFTRRALLKRKELGLSTAGGQASLQTLVDEPDFAIASFLLSVLGEGSFLTCSGFSNASRRTRSPPRCAGSPRRTRPATSPSGCRTSASTCEAAPSLRETLMNAVRRRHESLRHTAGLNAEVFDALVLLAAGSWECEDIGKGHDAVTALVQEMHAGRKGRLLKLGFSDADAEEMSALHTRNFM